MTNEREAFVTMLNTDSYLPGVLVLDQTIRDTCAHPLFVLASRDLAQASYEALARREIRFCLADDVAVDPALFADPDPRYAHWAKTFLKFRIFELTQYDKIVFLDSDIMVLEPLDELFSRPDMSAVIADGSHPDNKDWHDLNSGVLVIEPRTGIVDQLVGFLPTVAEKKRFFGDQDVLAAYFDRWSEEEYLHLPDEYNVFFKHYQFYRRNGRVKVLHFCGKQKPWMMSKLRVFAECLRCFAQGNAGGARMLLHYRACLKRAYRHG